MVLPRGIGESEMYMPSLEFHQATTLPEAFDLLQTCGPSTRVLAGGTDLLVDLKAKRISTDHVISITHIGELKGISLENGSLRIGALTTITQLDESPLLEGSFDPIRDATRLMAVRQIRNVATIGGNLASAVPCADLPPILIAMNARVHIASRDGEREVPIKEFLLDVRKTALDRHDILSAITVPQPPPRFGAAYERFGLREGNAIAVAAVAVGIRLASDGTLETATIVLSAVSPIPKIALQASSIVQGQHPSDDLFARAGEVARGEADPISDIRGSTSFRRDLVAVLVQRALTNAVRRAGGEVL